MDDKGLISQVDDPRDTIARLERCHGAGDELAAREVLDGPMIITVLNILQGKHKQALEYGKTYFSIFLPYLLPLHFIGMEIGKENGVCLRGKDTVVEKSPKKVTFYELTSEASLYCYLMILHL